MIKVLIADDHQLLSDLIKYKLSDNSEITVVGCAINGIQAIEMVDKLRPDVLLLDIVMPLCDGIEVTKIVKSNYENIKILILTSSISENNIREALKYGADGYVLKNISENDLILAIKSINANMEVIQSNLREIANQNFVEKKPETPGKVMVNISGNNIEISEREIQIIKMLSNGDSVEDMANQFNISEGRVRNIITGIISKLQVHDKTQIVIFAIKNKLV